MITNATISWVQLFSLTLAVTCILLVWQLLSVFFQTQKEQDQKDVWAKIETVGVSSGGILSWSRAVIGSISSLRQNSHDGYSKISKMKGRPFALPSMWTGGAVVVLPSSLLFLLNRPDTELSGLPALLETVRLPYMFPREIYEKLIHFEVVRKKMAKKDFIGSLATTTAEETDIAFRESWGMSKDWRNMNGWEACERIITQSSMRILIGLPKCRDENLLNMCSLFANSVLGSSAIINCLPPFLRPVLGPVLAIQAKYYRTRCQKLLVPLIEERIRLWRDSKEEDDLPVCTESLGHTFLE